MPQGWLVVPKARDPFFGKPYSENGNLVYPIVAPNDDESLHMMGPQAQFSRRLILSRKSEAKKARQHHNAAGLAVCEPLSELGGFLGPAGVTEGSNPGFGTSHSEGSLRWAEYRGALLR